MAATGNTTTTTTNGNKKKDTNNNNDDDVVIFSCCHDTESAKNQWLGAFCVSFFISTWMVSIFSPLLLYLSIKCEWYITASLIIVISIISYLPWEHGYFSDKMTYFLNRYHPLYYKSMKLIFENGDGITKDSAGAHTATNGADAKTGFNLSDTKQTFYAVHPHGAFCIGWSILFKLPIMRGIKFCFAPILYASPFFRLFTRTCGCPGSASRDSMVSYLKEGKSVALPPGGFEEATLTCPDIDRVYAKKRTGFIKLCLQYGVQQIRPVYVFGEVNLFDNVQGAFDLRLKLNRYNIPGLIFPWGRWFCPVLPKNNVPVLIVVGKPLVLPTISNITREDVELWHGKYVTELKRLYDKYKDQGYGSEKGKVSKLEIW